jgi:hypothetical protein
MHESTGAMRAAQGFQQPRDPLQPELRRLDFIAERVKKPD